MKPLPIIVHEYLASIGRRGGASQSPRKQRAVRRNGRLGGRPQKIKEDKQRGTT